MSVRELLIGCGRFVLLPLAGLNGCVTSAATPPSELDGVISISKSHLALRLHSHCGGLIANFNHFHGYVKVK